MEFIRYLFRSKRDSIISIALMLILFSFYILCDYKIVHLLHNGQEISKGPFVHTPFKLNLFNFDPAMFYGEDGSIITHPYLRNIAFFIQYLTELGPQNLVILIIQSLLVAATSSLIYVYCRNIKLHITPSILITMLFGISTYSLLCAFVPDSYPYAQFFIVLSVVYFQYVNQTKTSSVAALSVLGVVNLGITLTNVIPFAVSLLVTKLDKNIKGYIRKLLLTGVSGVLLLVILALIDKYIYPGVSWIDNWTAGLQSGGYNYVAKFSFETHKHVLNSLFVAPFLFPKLQVLDPKGLIAIVTQLKEPFPILIQVVGIVILCMSVLGLLFNLKERNVWILIVYIGFSVWLHLIKGYGLATHEYDLLLYAGHYMFAITLGIAWLVKRFQQYKVVNILLFATLLFITSIQIFNNYQMVGDLKTLIEQVYLQP
ncbi:DUF6080 domain-containing protein [Microbacteriaceae bacterium 4G12]